ncbi:MAG: hypothetical protein Q7S02_06005, partial [bacterium]|nr:hypothetical protein [bacterium]
GAAVAVVGWFDDRRQLRARVRIAVHTLAAVWALWWIGGLDHLSIGSSVRSLGAMGTVLAFLAIVGFSNLYNFMDGIDGLIGSESVVVGGVLGLLAFLAGAPGIAMALWVLAAASLGFLVWNWHPARIFMGDVGSVLLGFSFVTIAIALEQFRFVPGLLAVVLLAVVVVDAGFTTIRRALRGERWYEAHRTFSYQRAVQAGHRHSTVVLGVLVLEVVLVACALVAWLQPPLLIPAMLSALILTTIPWAWYQFSHGASLIAEPKQGQKGFARPLRSGEAGVVQGVKPLVKV